MDRWLGVGWVAKTYGVMLSHAIAPRLHREGSGEDIKLVY